MNANTYPSRIDGWLIVVELVVFVLVLAQAALAWRVSPAASIMAVAVLAGMIGLVLLVGWPCRYTLAADHLEIQSGVVRWRVPYAGITGVELSSSVWAAPALSLRRVKITCGRRFWLVSPVDREAFMAALEQARLRAEKA